VNNGAGAWKPTIGENGALDAASAVPGERSDMRGVLCLPSREYRDGMQSMTGSPLDERVDKAVE
jgi:hypothetical protein